MYRQSEKNLLNGNISFICRHNMLNFGPLMAKINWRVWDTQQISTGFTHWLRYCTDIAQLTSTKLCTMLGRLLCWYAIFTFSEALAPLTEFCQLRNSLCVQILLSYIGSVTARYSSTGRQANFVGLSRGCHLYLAGWPSPWASAHILVMYIFPVDYAMHNQSVIYKLQ